MTNGAVAIDRKKWIWMSDWDYLSWYPMYLWTTLRYTYVQNVKYLDYIVWILLTSMRKVKHPSVCMSIWRFTVFFIHTIGFLAVFVFLKIQFFFQNGSPSLHVEVVITNITAQPSLVFYTETTKCLDLCNNTLVEVESRYKIIKL